MRSSICSGNQIRVSNGAETSVTIQKPLGIGHAAIYATATTTRDNVRERSSVIERLTAKLRAGRCRRIRATGRHGALQRLSGFTDRVRIIAAAPL